MKPYPKYKTTNIPWLQEVPEGWEVQGARVLFGENSKSNVEMETSNALQFQFGEIIQKKRLETDENLSRYTIVEKDDIMVNGLNLNYDFLTQRVAIVKEKGAITPAYISLRPTKLINPMYACYLLKAMDSQKMINGMGTGIRLTLSFSEFKKIELPLPPLSVQSQIVNFLDGKVSAIDRLIEAKRRQIELLKEELFAYLFSEKGDVASLGYWDDCFPKNWESTTVKHLFNETSKKGYNDKELLAVTQDRGVLYKKDCSENFVSPSGDFFTQKLVEPHDFIISLRSFQGGIEASYVEGLVSPAYTVFAMNEYDEQLFIYYRYLFKTQSFIAFLNTLVADTRDGKKIGFKDFRDFYMPLPPKNHLEKIKGLSKRLDILVLQVDKQQQLLVDYKTRLISDVVTGKLDISNVTSQEKTEAKVIEFTPKAQKTHSKGYEDAVILAALVNAFGTEEHPFTAFDCQKFPYLLHRHIEGVAENYNKFAAGPYNPALKYKTARPIALKKKYIREHIGKYKGFVADENVPEAMNYFMEWYSNKPLEWINQFRYIKNRKNELELLATVDMAIVELRENGMPVIMPSVKDLIKKSPAWKDKLTRPIFSDDNIERAIEWSYKLFGNN
jgi:type I restriction enzyme S subunit